MRLAKLFEFRASGRGRFARILHIPFDSYTELVVDFSRGEVEILKKMLDEDIAYCVADLREEYGGSVSTSVEWGGARYYEPLSDDFSTIVAQIEDINRIIAKCRRKLGK